MKVIGMTLLMIASLSAIVLPWGQSQENERSTFQGSWTAIVVERNGKPASDFMGNILMLRNGQFTIKSQAGELLYHGTYQFNENVTPGTIDFIHKDDWLLGTTWKGIFKLEGQTLRICDNAPFPSGERPTDFTTRPESNRVSIVFQRNS